ncbi:MAG: HAMP domain-containing protein [Opitutaceae bacterium]|nr:HAMP domain-containing protein [Opitutaceae bacterium]
MSALVDDPKAVPVTGTEPDVPVARIGGVSAARKGTSFHFRLIAFALALMGVAVGISSLIAYRLKKQSLEESLARELLAIVKSVAPLIDGDVHERVRPGESGSSSLSEDFLKLRDQLVKVKSGNALLSRGSPLYTMRKPDDFVISGELEFVVMTDPDDSGQYFTGARYHVEPHLLAALGGTASSTGVYTDDEGVWISAAAPIRNAAGTVVGVVQADRPIDFYYAEARSVALKIFGGAASSLTIGAALAFFFARSLTGPIRRLAKATEAVARGNFGYRVSESRTDELGDLARSFNGMACELTLGRERENYQKQELVEANRRTEAVNRQLAEANHDLERAVEEAQRLEEEARAGELAKTEFLATMSHELRTPLNGIFGFAQVLETTEMSKEQVECVGSIQQSADRLLKTISAVLEYSQLDRGKRPREWGNVTLRPLLSTAAAAHRNAALSKGLEFTFSIAPDIPTTIRADGPALQRVVDVLLSNAVKFTVTGSVGIAITAERAACPLPRAAGALASEIDADLHVVVTDTGIGIPAANRTRLFLPFVQGDASLSRAYEGIGLGLAIAHKLARSAGGDLLLVPGDDRGATFKLVLPARC